MVDEHPSSSDIYWPLLRTLQHRLSPVSSYPPAQLMEQRVTPGGRGHEFVLAYFRWQLRIQLVPCQDRIPAAVSVRISIREAGMASRILHGGWREILTYQFDQVPNSGSIVGLLADLDRRLRASARR
jgi:hypothetical protein